MKKSIFILLVSIFSCSGIFSQGIGEWNPHFSYEKDVTNIVQAGDVVYAVSDGKLFSYDPSEDTMETYVKIGEDSVSHVGYSEKHKCLVVVRYNSDVDLLYPGDGIITLSDIKNMSLNLDKAINDVFIDDDYAYLSTNYGMTIINISKAEIKESALFRYPFYSSVVKDDKLYAFTSNGTICIDKSLNIQYPDSWEKINLASKYSGSKTFTDSEVRKSILIDNDLIFLIPSKACYSYTGDVVNDITQITDPQKMIKTKSNRVIVFNTSKFWNITGLNGIESFNIETGDELQYVVPDNTKSNEYWVALKGKQLSLIKVESGNGYSFLSESKRPNGPSSNYPFKMIFKQDKLLTVGGFATNRSGGYPAQLNEYKNGIWFQFKKEQIEDISGVTAKDFVDVEVDPSDPDHIFVTCFGELLPNINLANGGIYEFQNRELVKFYNHKNSSFIESVFGTTNIVAMMGLSYDLKGNLWVQNPGNTKKGMVVRKNDGTWTSLEYADIKSIDTNARTLIVDKYNNKWSATYRGDSYLFIVNEGTASIDNVNAHSTKFVSSNDFYDQDGQKLENFDHISCLAEDKNGNIWVGTDVGIFVIYNSTRLFSEDYKIVFNKIKVPKNDGTNEANILLENVRIQDIKVDGANRKWIATSSGLYVVSSNGFETYHYFTTENSILPSNNVISLGIDPKTGLVFIGTDKGLVSYKGEAVDGAKDYSNVYAYPNPVRPDYDGPIAIIGLKEDSNVKITDVKGNLINQGKSLGGQYIWNGRNIKKEKVSTGVYLVFGSSDDGQEGVVTKIMVVSN